MPAYVYIAVAATIIIGLLALAFRYLSNGNHTGGNVREKHCHHDHDCIEEPIEVIVRFEEPLEINLNIKIENVPPEQEVTGALTLGPVSEKKI